MATDFFDNWQTQLRKGTLELCVLCALRGRKLYGYDLVKRLCAAGGLGMSEGTVYPMLSRFKREGLVTATLVESSEGPARKYYELTPRGRNLLARMLDHWQAVRGGIDALGSEGWS
jgi:PadR family transcriptional regulator, regulatory protein PadR